MRARTHRPKNAQHGFTLVEVLVAISILSIMAVLSWRALDGMSRAQVQAQAYTNEVMTLNAAISQWKTDLDRQFTPLNPSIVPAEPIAMLWDGQSMRITRYSSQTASDGMLVVAWARQQDQGQTVWRRWQSGPLTTMGAWRSAWAAAGQWIAQGGTTSNGPAAPQASSLVALTDWQVSYYRGGTWTNALSAGTTQMQTGDETTQTQISTQNQGAVDGVRLNLTLPPGGHAFTGQLTVDWVRPTRGGGR